MTDWKLRGIAPISGLEGLPDSILETRDARVFAVFSDGERVMLVPSDQVEP